MAIQIQYIVIRADVPGSELVAQIVTDEGKLADESGFRGLSLAAPPASQLVADALALLEQVRAAAQTKYGKAVTIKQPSA